MSQPGRLRIYGNIRTAHLERLGGMVQARVVFNKCRYDYQESIVAGQARPIQMSRIRIVGHLLRHRYGTVEVNEPLVWRRWPDLLAQVLAIRIRGGFGSGRTRIVAYAIGYSDPAREISALRGWIPPWLARMVTWLAAQVLVRSADRLAFGSQGSMEMYRGYAGRRSIDRRSRLFEALPAPCTCTPVRAEPSDGGRILLFVGAFSDRKGVRQLMAAWDHARLTDPTIRLHLIGKGPLAAAVREWSAARPEVRMDEDPARQFIHRSMRTATALVLLSQPIGAWREQVGLPIVEGLSHGLEIISTPETGIAEWLSNHGHQVVPVSSGPNVVAAVILEVLRGSRAKEQVLADLPSVDQRLAADHWLMLA